MYYALLYISAVERPYSTELLIDIISIHCLRLLSDQFLFALDVQ